ncbi:MAG: hypothetical protein LUG26_04660 [Ruminococcus sp.]|nr:hypothetical protein [Ruminococcus sp.]
MTRKESALDVLNKKIPKLEEKINQDKQLLEQLKENVKRLRWKRYERFYTKTD